MWFFRKKKTIKFLPVGNSQEVIKNVADQIIQQVLQKPNATLCFSCEKNVLQIFNAIITQTHSYHQLNFNDVQLFNANDFYNLPDKFLHIANCKKIDKHFVEPLNLNSSNITYLTHKNYRNYDALIKNRGGIDLLVLEINNNGKIAFNEPNTPHYIKTHIAKLSQTTRFEYKPSFANDLDEVPHKAITIGLRTILKAKKIILVGIGKDSDVSISKLFEDKYNPIWPITILNYHPNVTLHADLEACRMISTVTN